MLLSIIIPIYNVEPYLKTTLDTVLSQTFTDFELILVDDGSTDGSGKICDEYAKRDSRIVVIHKENEGVSEARNIGVSTAKGEYIGFVDSDDIIEPCMYELMIKASKKYDCEIIQCEHNRNGFLSYQNFEIIEGKNFEVNTGDKVVRDIFIKKGGRCTNILSLCTKIYKRYLFDGIVFPKGKVFEDEARTYQVILKANRVGELNLPLYHYVKRENSIITGIAIEKMFNRAWAIKDRAEFFRNRDKELYKKSISEYLNWLKAISNDINKGIVIRKDDDEKVLMKLFTDDYKDFMKVADIYTKIYLFMIKHNIMASWVRKNDFEPIQNIVRKIRHIEV